MERAVAAAESESLICTICGDTALGYNNIYFICDRWNVSRIRDCKSLIFEHMFQIRANQISSKALNSDIIIQLTKTNYTFN